jgi:hypothetical protein
VVNPAAIYPGGWWELVAMIVLGGDCRSTVISWVLDAVQLLAMFNLFVAIGIEDVAAMDSNLLTP